MSHTKHQSSTPPLKVIPDFVPLSDSISLYTPPATSSFTGRSNQPSMIILCTWLGNAQLKHISKYTTAYRALLPGTQILLIRSQVADMTFRSFPTQKSRLKPAQKAIQACLSGSGVGNGKIILHMFSHAGANAAIQLALLLKQSSVPFPLQAIILDSTPGRGSFKENHAALKLSSPRSPVLGLLFQLLLVPILVLINTLQVLGVMRDIGDLREALNNDDIFEKGVGRLYLYSKADVMVHWQDVERHADEARRRGARVEEVVWEKEGHCGLVVGDEGKRYWGAVSKIWEDGKM